MKTVVLNIKVQPGSYYRQTMENIAKKVGEIIAEQENIKDFSYVKAGNVDYIKKEKKVTGWVSIEKFVPEYDSSKVLGVYDFVAYISWEVKSNGEKLLVGAKCKECGYYLDGDTYGEYLHADGVCECPRCGNTDWKEITKEQKTFTPIITKIEYKPSR